MLEGPAHQSALVIKRGANFFLWWSEPTGLGRIIACLNLDIVGPLTAETLVRWIKLIAQPGPNLRFKHTRLEYLDDDPRHGSLISGAAVSNDEKLSKGDYECFLDGPEQSVHIDSFSVATYDRSLGALKRQAEEEIAEYQDPQSQDLTLYNVLPELLQEAERKNKSTCVFSGCSRVQPQWIFPPPAMGHTSSIMTESPVLWDLDAFKGYHNTFAIRPDLYDLWLENAFSVDVDDNYRIRTFTQAAVSALTGMPTHLASPDLDRNAEFFKEHFRWTLTTHVLGGDIDDDSSDSMDGPVNFEECLDAEDYADEDEDDL
ncbi:hypothetical protein C8Q76DRAFT_855918 [Earliella scabrosa]|nr:hypothetical protein C8Q76DRAFT_855918 [Earliella scabrosa]